MKSSRPNTGSRNARRTIATAALVPALALGVSACGTDDAAASSTEPAAVDSAAPENATRTDAAPASAADAAIVLEGGWVKATDEDMSAVFGTLSNTTNEDVTITGATTDAAETVQLHTTETSGGSSTMKEKEGGFVVPAGGTLELAPGGEHLMLMGLTGEIEAGDEVEVDLHTSAGDVPLSVVAKEYSGAQEHYDMDE